MANRENKDANKFINKHGEEVAKMEGGNQVLGLNEGGPVKGGIVAQAQAYKGDVKPNTPIANLQQNAMKK